MPTNKSLLTAIAAAALTAGCLGGGSSSETSSGNSTTSATEQFPTGVSVSAPTDLATSASVSQVARVSAPRYFADLGRSLAAAWAERDGAALARIASALVPINRAEATPAMIPEFARHAAIIDAIIAARVNPGSYIDWNDLLSTATNDPCYGPSISYSDHDDGTPASGTLPGGDLGMFKDTATDSQPCSVAELKARTRSTKHKTAQGLIIAAAMRKAVRDASLAMPDAGASIDITTQMQPVIQAANANATVSAATISKSSGGHYSYRLRATDTTANVTVELLLTHRPGASATAHGGTLTITVSSLTTDAAAGCTDQMSGANYKVSSVQTVRYRRASDTIDFSARQSRYCGHGDTAQTNLAATIAALDSNDELDPAVKLAGNVRGSSKGWRGDFSRAAGTLDRVAQDGNFLYAWQAGTGDSHSRMFAVTTSYNSTSETRTGKAFFGYAAAVDTTIGSMLGMICNWAGPGNVHTPNSRFQYQTATLSTTGTRWTLGTSKIRYAPTNSCDSSSTMEFDANADNTLGATEGNSTTNDLDSKGSSASVAAELAARGFTVPTFF